ncbi:hypothetical protein Aph02nite_12270 [Actinoplanes philippinensis]|uniref:DUF4360 domain-containing protein n=1 Tax=Actinoplanes philippinensis TaxID=35752 RepID=A0A1I1ZXM7_9ACTN|nr:DUF4360 domain-containing protein [Actinoplanes philippinensis]GIE75277.1 hypothetical protein Aph02nite_12270 [Actinoplanes philippinensis]SFE35433.1 protein of unknown function [Actinoplanes philippinensis]
MLNVIAAGAMLLSTLGGVPAPGTHIVEPPDDMTISVVSANGSGCPQGSAVVEVSPDNKAFTVSYSKFVAEVGPQSGALDYRKQCQIALNVLIPSGYTYGIARADYRGYARLEEGATASETAFYYFQGMSKTGVSKYQFSGFMDDSWQVTDEIEVEAITWLPCGSSRYLNINTELKVNRGWSNKSTTSFITMDSSDLNLDTIYRVAWKQCPF